VEQLLAIRKYLTHAVAIECGMPQSNFQLHSSRSSSSIGSRTSFYSQSNMTSRGYENRENASDSDRLPLPTKGVLPLSSHNREGMSSRQSHDREIHMERSKGPSRCSTPRGSCGGHEWSSEAMPDIVEAANLAIRTRLAFHKIQVSDRCLRYTFADISSVIRYAFNSKGMSCPM
jgi:hypothetical protein